VAQGNLRLPGPDRDLAPAEWWKNFELYAGGAGGADVFVTQRNRGEGVRQIIPLKGFAFFLWGPDVDQAWTSPSETKTEAKAESDQGGAPSKLPRGAEKEIRRRIGRGEIKIAPEMAKKYPGVMDKRTWQLHVRRLRGEMAKAK
jgi:hypothetical protein